MPVYEYRCLKCGNVFEKLQRFSDAPVTVHEECGGPVEKLISRSGFHLKGSGWYVTDYAKGSSSSPSGHESKSDGGSEAKAESKSGESKSSESTSTESKSSSDSKTSDSKKSDTKSSESKPATTTTKSE